MILFIPVFIRSLAQVDTNNKVETLKNTDQTRPIAVHRAFGLLLFMKIRRL